MALTTVSDFDRIYKKIDDLQQQIIDLNEVVKKNQKQNLSKQEDYDKGFELIFYPEFVLNEEETSWDVVRKKRDFLLKSTDWVMTSGCTLPQSDWAKYRQQLRDLPQVYRSAKLEEIKWPTPPSLTPKKRR